MGSVARAIKEFFGGFGFALSFGLGVLAVAGGTVALVLWLHHQSPSEHARSAVQELYSNRKPAPRVESCTEVRRDQEAVVYRCRITTESCTRRFTFAVYNNSWYQTVPATAPITILRDPCRFKSD
jgi:hypothetical protein